MKKVEQRKNEKPTDISVIEKELLKTDPKIFEGVSSKDKETLIRKVMSVSLQKTHSGPLPDSQTLQEYNLLIPDGANRIMAVFENQSAHRIEIEKKVIKGQILQSNLGQIFALTIGLFALTCATFCIYTGHEWSGAIIGTGGLTSLVLAFIKGKDYQQKNLSSKKTS